MTRRSSEPPIPADAHETVRQVILAALEAGPCTAHELSGEAGIPERDVEGHLEHLKRSIEKSGGRFVIDPAECKRCGFVFRKRERLSRPGKCPVCRGESISAPRYSVLRS